MLLANTSTSSAIKVTEQEYNQLYAFIINKCAVLICLQGLVAGRYKSLDATLSMIQYLLNICIFSFSQTPRKIPVALLRSFSLNNKVGN